MSRASAPNGEPRGFHADRASRHPRSELGGVKRSSLREVAADLVPQHPHHRIACARPRTTATVTRCRDPAKCCSVHPVSTTSSPLVAAVERSTTHALTTSWTSRAVVNTLGAICFQKREPCRRRRNERATPREHDRQSDRMASLVMSGTIPRASAPSRGTAAVWRIDDSESGG
jgi:hypothetical protein